MIDLSGTSAAGVKFVDFNRPVFLVVVRADAPTMGEDPQYFGSRQFQLDGDTYEDLMAGLSFEFTELPLKGGLATVATFQLTLRNEAKLAQLVDQVFLENDDVEAYLLFADDAGNVSGDRIPIGRGLIDQYPSDVNEWTMDMVDGSDRDWVAIPNRLIEPTSFPFAPLDTMGKPLPVPFGLMEQGPYDDAGTTRFLAPCRCVDIFQQRYTAGLNNASASTLFQWYPQARKLADILNTTDDGPYVTIDSPARKLWSRPVRPDTTNTVGPWSSVADGRTATSVTLSSSEALDLFFGGVPKLGTLTQLSVEIIATGSFTYSVELASATLASGSATGDISIALDIANWTDDWDFELLLAKIATSSTATLKELFLDIRFDDQSGIDAQNGLQLFRKVQGFADVASSYNADGTTNPLITGTAGTVLVNPVDILQAILRGKDLLNRPADELDLTSFNTARAKRAGWTYAFTIWETIRDITWLDPFLQEAGLHLFKNAAGTWTVIARDTFAEPQHAFLDGWNIAIKNPEDDYGDFLPDIEIDRVKNRDLVNEFVIHAQRDRTSDEYNLLKIASSAYRITGTGATDPVAGEFLGDGTSLMSDGLEVGWIIYMDTDQAYRTTAAPMSETRVPIEPVSGSLIFPNAPGTTFWAGTNLDPEVLRSRRRYKTVNPLGRARQDLRDIGGYESQFIGDAQTAQLLIDHWREWHGQLPHIVPLSTFIGHIDVEPGDVCFLDHPWLPNKKRPVTLTSLDGGITAAATTIKVQDGDVELIHEEDFLIVSDNPRQPEIVKVSGIDGVTDIATIVRGQAGTQAMPHADGTLVKRITVKWEVIGVQPPAPDDVRIRLKLLETPNSYFPPIVIAPDGTPDWSGMTDEERLRYGAITYNSGLVEERDPTSGFFIAA